MVAVIVEDGRVMVAGMVNNSVAVTVSEPSATNLAFLDPVCMEKLGIAY